MKVGLNLHIQNINNFKSKKAIGRAVSSPMARDSFELKNNPKVNFCASYGVEKCCPELDFNQIRSMEQEIIQIKLSALKITKRAQSASVPQNRELENTFVDGENEIYEVFLFSTDSKLNRYAKVTDNLLTGETTTEKFSFLNGYDLLKYEKTVRTKDLKDGDLKSFLEQRVDFCDDCSTSKIEKTTFLPTCTKTQETQVSFDENCNLRHFSNKKGLKVNRRQF